MTEFKGDVLVPFTSSCFHVNIPFTAPTPLHGTKKKKKKEKKRHACMKHRHAHMHTCTHTCLLRPTARCRLVIMMYMIGVHLTVCSCRCFKCPMKDKSHLLPPQCLNYLPLQWCPLAICVRACALRSVSFLLIFLSFILYVVLAVLIFL